MILYHKLTEILLSLLITCNDEKVEQVKSWKLLGVESDQNLNWNNFIDNELKNCYSILAESLIISKLDNGNILFEKNTSLINKKNAKDVKSKLQFRTK